MFMEKGYYTTNIKKLVVLKGEPPTMIPDQSSSRISGRNSGFCPRAFARSLPSSARTWSPWIVWPYCSGDSTLAHKRRLNNNCIRSAERECIKDGFMTVSRNYRDVFSLQIRILGTIILVARKGY